MGNYKPNTIVRLKIQATTRVCSFLYLHDVNVNGHIVYGCKHEPKNQNILYGNKLKFALKKFEHKIEIKNTNCPLPQINSTYINSIS